MEPHPDTRAYAPEELCTRIEILTGSIMEFWRHSGGWAPLDVSTLLDRSRLDWQASLASSLSRWLDAESPGDLILAWANLGALVEGQLKLFLSVYYLDYQSDIDAIKRRGELLDPDGCMLDQLRQFFSKRIWTTDTNWNEYVQLVQWRRNAIHAYQQRSIGTVHEWQESLRLHLSFVRDTSGSLPYPDEGCHVLREV